MKCSGGVGITPVMAILKQLEHDAGRPVEIIHSAADYLLFSGELKKMAEANNAVTLHQTSNKKETQELILTLGRVLKFNSLILMPNFALKKRAVFCHRCHYACKNARISTQNWAVITSKAISKHTLAKEYKNLAYYYISESFDIIKSVRKILIKQGIKGKRLVHDPLLGY